MSKNSQLLSSLKERLEDLNCPYLEDGSEQWLAELLLHPSESRLQLLTWIVSNVDPAFEEMLTDSVPVISNRLDSRYQKLLLVLSMCLACRVDDMELVRGTSSQKRQLAFWDNLVDLLHVAQFGTIASRQPNNNKSYDLKPPRELSAGEIFKNACLFTDSLMREHKIANLFSTQVRLFPPDVEDIVDKDTIPTLDELIEVTERMKADLATQTRELETLRNNVNITDHDQQSVENYCRKLDVSLRTLLQMADLFVHNYDAEIAVWCRRPTTKSSQVGPTVNSVAALNQHHQALARDLNDLRAASTFLTNDLKQRSRWNEENLTSNDEINRIRAQTEILKESIKRYR